jgi:cytochrome c oxidase assembly factor CtaG
MGPLGLPRWLTAWGFDPVVVALLLASAALYLRAVRSARARHPGPNAGAELTRRAWYFLGGLAVLYVALQSPIEAYSEQRLAVHMVQHLLLTMLAAPLLLLGAPVTLALRAATGEGRRRVLLPLLRSRVVRWLFSPLLGWSLFTVVMWATHFSPLYDAALRSTGLHALEHLAYMVSAALFWAPLLGVDPNPRRLSHPARILYMFLAMPQMSLLGLALWGTSGVLYPTYLATLGQSAAQADQQLAGTLMGSAGMLFLVPAMALVLLDWLRHEERAAARLEARESREVQESTA